MVVPASADLTHQSTVLHCFKTCSWQAIMLCCQKPLLSSRPLQRNDLRRSRMELAAATEDANQTRQELRVVRAELARSRAQQATVCCPPP